MFDREPLRKRGAAIVAAAAAILGAITLFTDAINPEQAAGVLAAITAVVLAVVELSRPEVTSVDDPRNRSGQSLAPAWDGPDPAVVAGNLTPLGSLEETKAFDEIDAYPIPSAE